MTHVYLCLSQTAICVCPALLISYSLHDATWQTQIAVCDLYMYTHTYTQHDTDHVFFAARCISLSCFADILLISDISKAGNTHQMYPSAICLLSRASATQSRIHACMHACMHAHDCIHPYTSNALTSRLHIYTHTTHTTHTVGAPSLLFSSCSKN